MSVKKKFFALMIASMVGVLSVAPTFADPEPTEQTFTDASTETGTTIPVNATIEKSYKLTLPATLSLSNFYDKTDERLGEGVKAKRIEIPVTCEMTTMKNNRINIALAPATLTGQNNSNNKVYLQRCNNVNSEENAQATKSQSNVVNGVGRGSTLNNSSNGTDPHTHEAEATTVTPLNDVTYSFVTAESKADGSTEFFYIPTDGSKFQAFPHFWLTNGEVGTYNGDYFVKPVDIYDVPVDSYHGVIQATWSSAPVDANLLQ